MQGQTPPSGGRMRVYTCRCKEGVYTCYCLNGCSCYNLRTMNTPLFVVAREQGFCLHTRVVMIECVACGKKYIFLPRGAVCCLGDWVTHRCIYCPGVNTNPPPWPSCNSCDRALYLLLAVIINWRMQSRAGNWPVRLQLLQTMERWSSDSQRVGGPQA